MAVHGKWCRRPGARAAARHAADGAKQSRNPSPNMSRLSLRAVLFFLVPLSLSALGGGSGTSLEMLVGGAGRVLAGGGGSGGGGGDGGSSSVASAGGGASPTGVAGVSPAAPSPVAHARAWPQTMASVPLYVVSLARSPKRWRAFVASGVAARSFPTLEQFPAVDGRSVSVRNDSRLSPTARVAILRGTRRDHTDITTAGMVGCYLSHLALWQRVLADGSALAVVMEDDAAVTPGARRHIDALLAALPGTDSWDVLLLGHAHPPTQAPSADHPGFADVSAWYGTIAYAVTARGAAALVRRALPIQFQVDGYMAQLAKRRELTVLHGPSAGDIRSMWFTRSDVQDTCHLCDLPHDYNRVADVAFWVALGAALTLAANALAEWRRVRAAALAPAPPATNAAAAAAQSSDKQSGGARGEEASLLPRERD